MPKRDERDWADVGARLREIRAGWGDTQPEFIQRMKAEIGYSVSLSDYSRMESGLKQVPRTWMPAIAQLDKQNRGPAWLAWGPSVELPTRQSVDPPPQNGHTRAPMWELGQPIPKRDKKKRA